MSIFYEKQKQHAAAWILRNLCTNNLWFDETADRKSSGRNYLYVPLFDIAESSKRYDLNMLKETCYFLQEKNHINIWGDDFDPRAMLVQISDEGINAYKKAIYGNKNATVIKRGLTAIAGFAAVIAIVIGVIRYASIKHEKYQSHAESRDAASETSQKTAAPFKVSAQ